ncbi:uncharacterized protein JN550_001092 [Neoarthrinium moseri]|uniref:uncharacterized protein n=1 Tax=Neoarthrinium moseri TaxID=1658444 RepID=UPI001FDB8B7F|nr:uncharacterized protein JN550_001092 [Neoarthrinium moseri]KAI1877020.1 hypothetical protein JN550_001092 [Neoarthrinium moseri]
MSDVESEDGRRASKKRKASRACDRCNVQHQPCDNASPKCSVCERAGTDCTYNRPIRKRGPRTGYTAQYGERLWGLVLQTNPEIEDLVLHTLATNTFGNTGVPNADYFKNNDHQAELVKRFNESRLGRFVQTGELPDLRTLKRSEASMSFATSAPVPLHQSPNSGEMGPSRGTGPRSRRSTLSATSKASPSINPHGAPQNPGEIYTLSEIFRKRGSHSETTASLPADDIIARKPSRDPAWQDFAAAGDTEIPAFDFNPNGFTNDYDALLRTPIQNGGLPSMRGPNQLSDLLKNASQPMADQDAAGAQSGGQQPVDFDFPDMNQWYESVPTETLLNLGFTGGDGMAQDFLDLCENPDPFESAPISPSGQNEDEEAVWRRLVMRGRFV